MAFLSGSVGFDRFSVSGEKPNPFSDEHIEILQNNSSGKRKFSGEEEVHVGFLGGDHLFDQNFDLEKNYINDAIHCGIRIDTNQVPSAIRKAWLQMELAALTAENPERKPTKAQKQEAKDAVEQRCADEVRSGKYLKMAQFPVLWDLNQDLFYFGGSSSSASGHAADLFERTFEIELSRITAGRLAIKWAEENNQRVALDDVSPAAFVEAHEGMGIAWMDNDADNFDFLGNEFIMWAWWYLETQSDTLTLADDTEVTMMLAKSLTLECPIGESGKETISSESPVKLPEAMQAIRSGKLPRRCGLSIVRFGQQIDLSLQAETFSISGAKIQADEEADGRVALESRIESIRQLGETIDQTYFAFLKRRLAKSWKNELEDIRKWLTSDAAASEKRRSRKPAA